jgi:hypothetical protein
MAVQAGNPGLVTTEAKGLAVRWCLEYFLRMQWTQRVTLLLLAFETPFPGQLIELLPKSLFATKIELGTEAIVAQQSDEMLLT